MGLALIEAAREAGVRITLLDTCYLSAGFGEPPAGVQVRYSDGDAAAWADRATDLAERSTDDGVVIGAAAHSVRAVPPEQLPTIAEWAGGQKPLHVHLSEQLVENRACMAAYSRTPAEVLALHG